MPLHRAISHQGRFVLLNPLFSLHMIVMWQNNVSCEFLFCRMPSCLERGREGVCCGLVGFSLCPSSCFSRLAGWSPSQKLLPVAASRWSPSQKLPPLLFLGGVATRSSSPSLFLGGVAPISSSPFTVYGWSHSQKLLSFTVSGWRPSQKLLPFANSR